MESESEEIRLAKIDADLLTSGVHSSLENVSHAWLQHRLHQATILLNILNTSDILSTYISHITEKLSLPEPKLVCVNCHREQVLDEFEEFVDEYYLKHSLPHIHTYSWMCRACTPSLRKHKILTPPYNSCYYAWKGGCDSDATPCVNCRVPFCNHHQNHKHKCFWIGCEKAIDRPNIFNYCEFHCRLVENMARK